MNNEPKKISFGFNKSTLKSNIIVRHQPVKEKIEIIKYLEEKKIVRENEEEPKGPLVIPMNTPNKKLSNLIDLIKNDFQTPESETKEDEEYNKPKTKDHQDQSKSLSLEEQAARELLSDSKNLDVKEVDKRIIAVPKGAEKETFEGEKESTIEDYEDIPVEEFGKAMLRGMGWKDGQGIGKSQQLIKVSQPLQRPKGMGLGADKITKTNKPEKPAVDRDGNTLKCVKRAYVKIIAGYHKGNYGQIIGFDDESGRFIIKMAVNNLNVSLNEFLVTPVTKEEYNKNSRIINNAKYEEYLKKKELENVKLEQSKIKVISKTDSSNDEIDRKKNERMDDKVRKNYGRSNCEDDRKNRDYKKSMKQEDQSSDSEIEEKYMKKNSMYKSTSKRNSNHCAKKERRSRSRSEVREDRYTQNKSKSYDSNSKYSEHKEYRKSNDVNDTRKGNRDSKNKYKQNDSDVSSDSDSYKSKQKTKNKKKKSKKHESDEESEKKNRIKLKKSDRKRNNSESDDDIKKYHDKRDRSRHGRSRI